jgi:hypothetical protein
VLLVGCQVLQPAGRELFGWPRARAWIVGAFVRVKKVAQQQ